MMPNKINNNQKNGKQILKLKKKLLEWYWKTFVKTK
jgi:hypothetical protein